MRSFPATLNRTLLIIIGFVMLAGGLWLIWPWFQTTVGLRVPEGASGLLADPSADLAPGATDVLEQSWMPAALIVVGMIVLLLGLAWLGRQVPRSRRAETLRFTADPGAGTTTLDPKVLESAVSQAAAALPQVAAAKAMLRGSVGAPDLLLQVHAEPAVHLPHLTATLTEQIAADVVLCLGHPLEHFAIEYSVEKSS